MSFDIFTSRCSPAVFFLQSEIEIPNNTVKQTVCMETDCTDVGLLHCLSYQHCLSFFYDTLQHTKATFHHPDSVFTGITL